MDPHGSTALVTGGARRVGRAIVLGLASSGCNVVIHHGSSPDEAEETAAEARDLGVEATAIQADLASNAAAVFAAAADLAPIRILVNSAAVFPMDTLAAVSVDAWQQTMTVNALAPVVLTRDFAAQVGDEGGVVVNVTDWRTERPYREHFSYTISKGALDTFTRAAAVALAPAIRVNAVALGAILPPPGRDADYLRDLATGIPLQRTGGTEPVVDAVLALIRNEFITGEILRVAGGAHLV
jgi:NAD(P)-dependent dehydrogenase (short-subunit alcohol dehydrogenase family)